MAAAIALMLEANPNLQPAAIKDILSRTATPTPKYFYHEAGAGMLNTYSAVLEAAFPDRHMGVFRSVLSQNQISFITSTPQLFTAAVYPGSPTSVNVPVPANTVQASISVSWNLSANDFGLKVYNSANSLAGESNYLNVPGLTGRHEKVVLRSPQAQTFRAAVQHTGTGTMQNVYGAVEVTQVQYPGLVRPFDADDKRPDTGGDQPFDECDLARRDKNSDRTRPLRGPSFIDLCSSRIGSTVFSGEPNVHRRSRYNNA